MLSKYMEMKNKLTDSMLTILSCILIKDIMNVIVWRNPHFFRTLSCLWNVQLNAAAVYSYCPFEWLKKSNITTARKINALHMNRASKRDYFSDEEYYDNNPLKVVNNCKCILIFSCHLYLIYKPDGNTYVFCR